MDGNRVKGESNMIRKILCVALATSSFILPASASTSDKSPGSVVAGTPMSIPRSAHSATRLMDGTVLIVGGMVEEGHDIDMAERYDPPTASFMPAGHLLTARNGHTATLLLDGRVLI